MAKSVLAYLKNHLDLNGDFLRSWRELPDQEESK